MNKQRRNALIKQGNALEELKSQLGYVIGAIEDVHDEEEEAYSNLPDSIQESERGETMQENIDSLDEAFSNLYDIISDIEDVIDTLKEVIER